MKEIVNKIIDLYTSPDGGAGGYGHTVFDDENVETTTVEWCLREAQEGGDKWICEDIRQKSIVALEAFLPLSEAERREAIQEAFGIIHGREGLL